MTAPGDHFSTVSRGYAAFRPRYPRALFELVASLAPARERAWDCGAGPGQATLDLAEWFDEVIATDVSAEQLAQAPRHPKITWSVGPAEAAPIADASIDAVTVAAALHWFDLARFYDEVRRVTRGPAALVAWAYGSVELPGALGRVVGEFEHGAMAAYWPAERRYVVEGYRTIAFPLERLATPTLELVVHWTAEQFMGYLRTWSASARHRERYGVDAVAAFAPALLAEWGEARTVREVRWPLYVLAGRVR